MVWNEAMPMLDVSCAEHVVRSLRVQVDPANLCASVSKEEYVPPEDVEFEQVWAPLPLLPNGQQSQAPEELVLEFADVVSQDKVLVRLGKGKVESGLVIRFARVRVVFFERPGSSTCLLPCPFALKKLCRRMGVDVDVFLCVT